uniref:ATP-dependent DNA helicase Q-like 3 isoform X1 n=1 Tax=Rhizophora mucronata TaxID=61149 RepID=A0A2P2JLV1_RHIMU
MPTLICPLHSNLVGMCVLLFTALNEQLVMACLLIFPRMAFPVLVLEFSFYLVK